MSRAIYGKVVGLEEVKFETSKVAVKFEFIQTDGIKLYLLVGVPRADATQYLPGSFTKFLMIPDDRDG